MIGSYGPIIFTVSSLRVLTFNNFTRTAKKRTASHEVIRGKPRTEYLGPDLQSVSFKCTLDATYGVRPRALIETLVQMSENQVAFPLIIGGMPIGFHVWSLDSVSVADEYMYNFGELMRAEVTLNLTEYVPTL